MPSTKHLTPGKLSLPKNVCNQLMVDLVKAVRVEREKERVQIKNTKGSIRPWYYRRTGLYLRLHIEGSLKAPIHSEL